MYGKHQLDTSPKSQIRLDNVKPQVAASIRDMSEYKCNTLKGTWNF